MGKKIDETGNVYGRLTVVEDDGLDKNGQYLWECLCECGKIKSIPGGALRRGLVVSCGCYNNEIRGKASITHGMSNTKIYKIWLGIISRCENHGHTSYPRYGAVGVSVCKEWRESFEAFYADMGDIPDGCEINRKRAANQYSKENCEWVSLSVQAYDKGMLCTNTSGRTGVNFDIDAGLWTAQLNKDGKVYKKRFTSFEDACKYRESLELEHFGFTKK
jgi:hypothetical protein